MLGPDGHAHGEGRADVYQIAPLATCDRSWLSDKEVLEARARYGDDPIIDDAEFEHLKQLIIDSGRTASALEKWAGGTPLGQWPRSLYREAKSQLEAAIAGKTGLRTTGNRPAGAGHHVLTA